MFSKTGILGGTFDPIHFGHIETGRKLIAMGVLDEILYIASGTPYSRKKNAVSGEHRYKMLCLALEGEQGLIPCDVELKREGISYTIDTMEELSEKYDDLYFITGADMLLDLPRWYRAEDLMRNYKFITVDRSESFKDEEYMKKAKELIEKYSMNVSFINVKTPDISSTVIRSTTDEKELLKYIPQSVLSYIKENKLYGQV